jgi:hypothetical protein
MTQRGQFRMAFDMRIKGAGGHSPDHPTLGLDKPGLVLGTGAKFLFTRELTATCLHIRIWNR